MDNTVKCVSASESKQGVGTLAGIIAGITYGLNPLFGLPLLKQGMDVYSMLFYRYAFAVVMMFVYVLCKHDRLQISKKQGGILAVLGMCYSLSSVFLFESYAFIPSGIATTIVYLYPVIVALMMVFLKSYPTVQIWISIVMTFIGVAFLSMPQEGGVFHWQGFLLAFLSALGYSIFVVIINRSRSMEKMANACVTLYSLILGAILFLVICMARGGLEPIADFSAFLMLLGLAFFPTVMSTAGVAYATKTIGATKTAVFGVFEPVTAIVVGVCAFNEVLTPSIVIGLVIAMAAIVFMTVSGKKKVPTHHGKCIKNKHIHC